MSEMLVFYINQGYQSFKDNKRVYYANYYILGQVNECMNPPENLKEYQLKENEAVINHLRYETVTEKFLGLHQILGYLMVRGDSDKCFLDYGYSKQNLKIYIVIIERECLIRFLEHFSIDIGFNTNLRLSTLIFQKFICFFH